MNYKPGDINEDGLEIEQDGDITREQSLRTSRQKQPEKAICAVCGEEKPIFDMESLFTGRAKYICFKCKTRGSQQVDGRKEAFFETAEGQKMLERRRKER